MMGGLESGYDMRDSQHQGTRYNGSGCLIHGLAVLADSFVAIDRIVAERPQDAEMLLCALRQNFAGYEELRAFLRACPKYGENESQPDGEAVAIANRVSDMVRGLTNYLGDPFLQLLDALHPPSVRLLGGRDAGRAARPRNAQLRHRSAGGRRGGRAGVWHCVDEAAL